MSDGRTWGTVIGGVVGFFTGGIGWAAGAAIGGVVGGLLEPKKHTETNRIDDIKVSLSKYGDGIPETFGGNIPSATCVWSTYVIQLPEKQSGGKGGGTENTNYRQFIQSMWCLGKTPPEGSTVSIRKAWIDGKLNYDSSNGLSASQALATEENPFASIAILPGFDDQLPVSLIELYEGVGNVPAFRGRICLFIFGLETPGGRIPQLQFELLIDADVGPEIITFVLSPSASEDEGGSLIKADSIWEWSTSYNGAGNPLTLSVRHGEAGALQPAGQMNIAEGGNTPYPVIGSDASIIAPYPTTGQLNLINLIDLTSEVLYTGGADGPGSNYGRAAYDAASELYAVCSWDDGATETPIAIVQPGADAIFCDTMPGDGDGACLAFYNNIVYAVVYDGTKPILVRRMQDGSANGAYPDIEGPVVNFGLRWSSVRVDTNGVYVYAVESSGFPGRLYKVDLAAEAWTLLLDDTGPTPATVSSTISSSFYSSDTLGIFGPTFSSGPPIGYNLIRFVVVTPVPARADDFIESQCLRAGLTADQFDVSTIDDTFWGLTLKSPASARANITPVMTYAGVGVVEEDGLLRFFHRKDHSSVVTIPYEELGFAEDGSEPGDPFPLVRANSQELSRSLTLTYNDPNFDYQVSTVKAFFPSADDGADDAETLDMAIDGSSAQTVCRRILLERRLSQITRTLAVSRKYSYLSAGDAFEVLSQTGSYGEWVASKVTDTGARIEIECFPSDTDLLIQSVPGPSGYRAQTIDPLAPQTRMLLLDSPIFRDTDNNAGLYVAAEGYGPGWHGYTLWVGDDDTNLEDRGFVNEPCPIGFAESALGDWTYNRLDGKNSVIVSMGEDDLSSTTELLLMTTRVNLALIGNDDRWEAIQFMTRSDLGSGRFLLYGLLRGLFGTERFCGTHQAGDRFVMISTTGMLRPNMDAGEIGQTKSYRPVSLGRSFNSVASVQFANEAVGLLPYSPWDARKSKAASNDQTLTWQRRSRLSTNALRGTVPLGEAAESYSIEFYTSSAFTTLAGTLTSTTKTLTITSAQQTAFGLTPGATLYVHIRQVSDIVGAGAPLEATL
ncbi:phage tail protein [Variovorax sp. J22R193]|uniref:phage tail protein n=1 Tax=Variovorax fucosicus TaxID=3053517 RepID=UPI0025777918|nr:phage tail protein [Variovorax sp. J22R193]MDM0041886.1 phage tail protein [Variovorax sp. J22R193]